MNRREFLATGAVALAAGCTTVARKCGGGGGGGILFGACRPLSDTALMKSVGFDFVENSFGAMFLPDKSEEVWKRQKEAIQSAALPLRSCNGFLPGTFRVTGKDADWEPILKYAETGCRRAPHRLGEPFVAHAGAVAVPAEIGLCHPRGTQLRGAVQHRFL